MKLTRLIHLFIFLMQICAIKGIIVKGKWYDASVNTTALITGEDLTILATVKSGKRSTVPVAWIGLRED